MRRHRFRKIPIATFKICRLPIPRHSIGVRLSLLSTVKTSHKSNKLIKQINNKQTGGWRRGISNIFKTNKINKNKWGWGLGQEKQVKHNYNETKLISFYSTKNYLLSARSRMCYVTDVNKTLHVIDICKLSYISI